MLCQVSWLYHDFEQGYLESLQNTKAYVRKQQIWINLPIMSLFSSIWNYFCFELYLPPTIQTYQNIHLCRKTNIKGNTLFQVRPKKTYCWRRQLDGEGGGILNWFRGCQLAPGIVNWLQGASGTSWSMDQNTGTKTPRLFVNNQGAG